MKMAFFQINKKKKAGSAVQELFHQYGKNTAEKNAFYLSDEGKVITGFIAPDGANTKPLSYMVVNDAGTDVYYAGLYVDKLPRNAVMAKTFARLFNADFAEKCVWIQPLLKDSISKINKRIKMLDAEAYTAEKNDDRNRVRMIGGKLREAEMWAQRVDSDVSSFYEICILFLLRAKTLEALQILISDFVGKAKNIGLASCYAAQPEAFLSAGPFNEIFSVSFDTRMGALKTCPVKKHIVDENYLATLFNHTHAEYFHENGVVFGRNMYSSMPITFDPFDRSRFSYGMIVAGEPGFGKSAMVKMLDARLVDFGVHIANIDFEPLPGNGKRGEYSVLAEIVGGVNYLISNDSDSRMNFFELGIEMEYDAKTGEEYPALNLDQKIVNMTNILMMMATSFAGNGKVSEFDPEQYGRIEKIISRCVANIYMKKGFVNHMPDSLYEELKTDPYRFGAGRKKKRLPQMRDFYMELMQLKKTNTDPFKEDAYHLLSDIFEDYVAELYYCPHCMSSFTKEEYDSLTPSVHGAKICPYHENETDRREVSAVHGMKGYMDCQSTIQMDMELPYHNFDLSQITDPNDRIVMLMVCQSYIEENFIKKNSMNPQKARKLILSTDEAHRILPYEGARRYENTLYRVARKRFVAPRLILQSVKDFALYKDTEEIVKSTETLFLFRHNHLDRSYIKDVTNLTDSQVDQILSLGGSRQQDSEKRYGELCLVDMPTNQAVFMVTDYLKNSEFDLMETDIRNITERNRSQGRA